MSCFRFKILEVQHSVPEDADQGAQEASQESNQRSEAQEPQTGPVPDSEHEPSSGQPGYEQEETLTVTGNEIESEEITTRNDLAMHVDEEPRVYESI